MKVLKTRNKKENHVEIVVTGERSEEVGLEIREALRKIKCRRDVSYCITIGDFPQ